MIWRYIYDIPPEENYNVSLRVAEEPFKSASSLDDDDRLLTNPNPVDVIYYIEYVIQTFHTVLFGSIP